MTRSTAYPTAYRRVRFLLMVLLFLASGAFATPSVPADTLLERLDALIASEAWQLALEVIEAEQPGTEDALREDLERRRVRVYRALGDVSALATRLQQLSPDAPPAFRHWAFEQLLETALAARRPSHAQLALEQLMASGDNGQVRIWRERLVRASLEAGKVSEALAAFAPLMGDARLRPLHAEILLHAGRDQEAFEQVVGLQSADARLWRLIAAMRLERYAPKDLVRELALLVRDLRDRPDLRRLAWLVRAEAAGRAGDMAPRVNSLEQALQLPASAGASLVQVDPDSLWSAYLALARDLASRERLVPGAAALSRADRRAKQDPYAARALYAWHALEAKDRSIRLLAHERLVASLSVRNLGRVCQALYVDSHRFAADEVPLTVRHALLEETLRRQDLRAAAVHARELERPPGGEPNSHWQLRRARVLLYGGDKQSAVKVLEDVLAADEGDIDFVRRFLQVVFDLQAMDAHAEALALLESVYAKIDNARMHRELLYWEAQSAAALDRLTDAAELYLRSAHFGDENGTDPWGHSARFHAADVLAKAGLTKDAESLYRALLKETTDPERRLLIEQNIERLWLAAPSPTTP